MPRLAYHEFTNFTYFRGRVALSSILKAMGIGKGDEVALQAFTCIAVPEAVLSTEAKPVYVDIEHDGFNMEPGDLLEKITRKTRAVIIQHTYGIPADVEAIKEVADKYGIPLIEDCCHTLSSTFDGRTVGSFGVASFYSFEWGKPLVVGVGGCATVNDKDFFEALEQQYGDLDAPSAFRSSRIKIQYLISRLLYRPVFYWRLRDLFHFLSLLGVIEGNYNPDLDIGDFALKMPLDRKRLLIKKLDRVSSRDQRALSITDQYRTRILSDRFKHPELSEDCDVVFVRYPLITDLKSEVLSRARKARIEVADWFATPIHPLEENEWTKVRYEKGACPVAEKMARRIITLPVHETVTDRYVDRAVDFLNDIN